MSRSSPKHFSVSYLCKSSTAKVAANKKAIARGHADFSDHIASSELVT